MGGFQPRNLTLVWIDKEVKAVECVGFSCSGENIFNIFDFENCFCLIESLTTIDLNENGKFLVFSIDY